MSAPLTWFYHLIPLTLYRDKHTIMKNNILFLCLLLALSACTKQSDNHQAGVTEGELFSLDITTLDNKIHTVYVSDLMESIEIIQLDTAREAYIAINQ